MDSVITRPTAKDVSDACEEFETENQQTEEALNELVKEFPGNHDQRHVLLKVVAINALYSTQIPLYSPRIPTVFDVADHIKTLDIDGALERQDPDLVDRVASIEVLEKGKRNNYSFATKYCSWHKQEAYPIWDSRVEEYLCYLCKVGAINAFKRERLWKYADFRNIVSEFRTKAELTEFSFKSLDKFMFQEGSKIMAFRTSQKSEKASPIIENPTAV